MSSEFGTHEPITSSLAATPAELRDFFHDLAESGYSHEKYSTVVYDDKRLIAAILCSVSQCEDVVKSPPINLETHDFAEDIAQGPYKQHKANQLVTFVTALQQKQDLLFGSGSKVFKLDICAVNVDYRGRGLCKELVRRAVKTAKTAECDWVAVAATASASQGLLSRLGFETLYEIPYTMFRENGVAVFQNLHDGCESGKFMALRVT
ncbi:unnamed protein product [Cylicocyclus nassatus]|uniref:N-acetyltransferase domain-containing protein n=1 Tax=Cylicocyclus nassatus TaxID=53992 RepID=A0AA36DQI5_CYLNA|nr:unnamed protein product [Cylicocyclus nassatus]